MAIFPFPQLAELREKYTYNITPFPTSVRSNGRFVTCSSRTGVLFFFLPPPLANAAFLSCQWRWQQRPERLGERRRRRHGRGGLGGDGSGLPGASGRPAGP